MPRPDREFLAHVTPLAEINAPHVIQVALERQRRLPHHLALAFGDPVQHATDCVAFKRGFGAEVFALGCLVRGEDHTGAKTRGTRVEAIRFEGGGGGGGGGGGRRGRGERWARRPDAPDGGLGRVENANVNFGAEFKAPEISGQCFHLWRIDLEEEGG